MTKVSPFSPKNTIYVVLVLADRDEKGRKIKKMKIKILLHSGKQNSAFEGLFGQLHIPRTRMGR